MVAETDERSEAQAAVALTALAEVGVYGGECFPWVRSIVFEATGRTIGFDYRTGYLEAGMVEVSLQEASAGDLIQIDNDANTYPWADYVGLHTAIVLRNEGDGTLTAIDSNWQFDGMVRVRERFDPAAAAARYSGLSYHVYRVSVDNTYE